MQAWDVDHSALAFFRRFLMRISAGVSPENCKRADEALRGELPRDQIDWATYHFHPALPSPEGMCSGLPLCDWSKKT